MTTTIENGRFDPFTMAEVRGALAHCTGGDEMHRHWTRRLNYTDGVLFMAERCGAHWLVDAIASHQSPRVVRACEGMQFWTLKYHPAEGRKAEHWTLTCRRDSGEPAIVCQKIEYSDFPLPEFVLWVEGDVLLLPSEH